MKKLLKIFTKAVAGLAVVTLAVSLNSAPAEAAINHDTALSKYQIFSDTNSQRSKAGKGRLQASPHLDSVAQYWANQLAKPGATWQHNPKLTEMVRKTAGWQAWGENIAGGHSDGKHVVVAWMNSPGHKANILNGSYNRIGIGVAYGGKYGVYYVQVFGANNSDPVRDIYPNPKSKKPSNIQLQRIAGKDRYETSLAVNNQKFKTTSDVVYLASGKNFPDALVASAAAGNQSAPVILIPDNAKQLTYNIKNKIWSLKPSKVIIVGGSSVISNSVVNDIKRYSSPNTQFIRQGGSDRYDTGRKIVDSVWTKDNVDTVYVATGRDYPDALAASAAAGSKKQPIVLLDGKKGSIDSATRNLINKLEPNKIIVVGGPGVVSNGVVNNLKKIASTSRLSGNDRYATAAAINNASFSNPKTHYWVSGRDFPDALTASVNAAIDNSPMYLVQPHCAPASAINAAKKQANKVIIVGGTGVVTGAVERFNQC